MHGACGPQRASDQRNEASEETARASAHAEQTKRIKEHKRHELYNADVGRCCRPFSGRRIAARNYNAYQQHSKHFRYTHYQSQGVISSRPDSKYDDFIVLPFELFYLLRYEQAIPKHV